MAEDGKAQGKPLVGCPTGDGRCPTPDKCWAAMECHQEVGDRLLRAYCNLDAMRGRIAELEATLEQERRLYARTPLPITAQELLEFCPSSRVVADAAVHIAKLEARVAELEDQLPDGMKECTIMLVECDKGHERLTAMNRTDHGCPTCRIAELEATIASYASAGATENGALRQECDRMAAENQSLRRRVTYWLGELTKIISAQDTMANSMLAAVEPKRENN